MPNWRWWWWLLSYSQRQRDRETDRQTDRQEKANTRQWFSGKNTHRLVRNASHCENVISWNCRWLVSQRCGGCGKTIIDTKLYFTAAPMKNHQQTESETRSLLKVNTTSLIFLWNTINKLKLKITPLTMKPITSFTKMHFRVTHSITASKVMTLR